MIREILIYMTSFIGLFVACFYLISLFVDRKTKIPQFPDKDPPKVSIIIPAWNEEKGIVQTISSALEIDYPRDKFEIIVVDDGSTDNTYKIASELKSKNVRVFRLSKNGGKGAAMNYAISKSSGEIIVTMDADNTRVSPDALKKMVAYFDSPKIMCVSPAMAIYKPKGILPRVQQIEYLLGVFLRKAFGTVNAIHITPGAFSAYRKVFFEKYGGFDEHNLTEDMEMALRVQYHQYFIVNNPNAVVYTICPNKFVNLMKQRRRWYTGLLKNFWKYRALFSKKYGIMGILVLPMAVISVILTILLTSYAVTDSVLKLKSRLVLWESINFSFMNFFEFNFRLIESYLFILFSDPISLLLIIFIGLLLGYMFFAKSKVKQHTDIKLSLIFFLLFFSLLFVFWWVISIIYTLFNRKVSWR